MAVSWTPPAESPLPGTVTVDSRQATEDGRQAQGLGPAFEQLAQRVRSEYREMPGLNLTRRQAQCLWGLGPETCDRVLAHLVKTGFLTRTWHDTYVRADIS